ncbi:hypothetical protein BGW38_008418 [Lunasporangiospora selenospora]|uniref:Peptidase A1 domain-containing protein n=1 Tax=Lunasporangiospora selenospora TaxID=979761 RepID=A0A9P6K9L3_9FUNG|nr:hypothetical protein BGW38_008418 [Lunasporangiospora selenospora]
MKIPNGFALQLCGRTENTTKSGNLFLGGYSNEHLAEPMQYVPLIKKDWYQVQLDGFRVMGEPIQGMQNLNVPKTIVDSGTTNVLMSHYNLVYLVSALAQSKIIRWSSLISQEDIHNFWFRNAVLRLPRSRFASSTPPDMVDEEHANGGAVLPGSVGTILGETLFAGKVVYFERGNEEAALGDPDFGRIGFGRGKNCFLSARHGSVDVLASQGRLVSMPGMGIGPVRVASTSDARRSGAGSADQAGSPKVASSQTPTTAGPVAPTHTNGNTVFHLGGFGFGGPIRLMGSAEQGPLAHWGAMRRSLVLATLVVVLAGWL